MRKLGRIAEEGKYLVIVSNVYQSYKLGSLCINWSIVHECKIIWRPVGEEFT